MTRLSTKPTSSYLRAHKAVAEPPFPLHFSTAAASTAPCCCLLLLPPPMLLRAAAPALFEQSETRQASTQSMSVHPSETHSPHAAFIEPQTHVNPNKRHITSQLWKRNESLSMKDGLHAAIKFITGDAYLGEWRANKPHGQGTLTYRSGNKIEGIGGAFSAFLTSAKVFCVGIS